jgi:DNA replication protein DnaD
MNSPHQSLTEITDDASLLRMWLTGKGKQTQKLYTRTVRQFFEFVGRELADVHLEDLLQWMESLVYRRYSKILSP